MPGSKKSDYAITTRIKARSGRLLSYDDYVSLSGCRTVGEILSAMRDLPDTQHIFAETSSNVHRDEMEHLLIYDYYNDLSTLFNAGYLMSSKLYKILTFDYAKNVLMDYARLYNTSHVEMLNLKTPDFIRKHLEFNIDELTMDKKPYEVLEVMKNSPLKSILLPYFGADVDKIDLVGLERDLQKGFFKLVFSLDTEAMDKKDRADFVNLYTRVAELQNIDSIVRAKKYYPNMTPDEIKEYIIPYYALIPEKKLLSLTEMSLKDIEKFFKNNKKFKLDFDRSIDLQTERETYNICQKVIKYSMGNASTLCAYMMLCRHRIICLTIIIESIRYNLPQETILSRLPV